MNMDKTLRQLVCWVLRKLQERLTPPDFQAVLEGSNLSVTTACQTCSSAWSAVLNVEFARESVRLRLYQQKRKKTGH